MPHSQLRFDRADLERLPDVNPASGYSLRTYLPGDASAWATVLNAAFGGSPWSVERIHREFLDSPLFIPERIRVAVHEDRIVGVAAAWEGLRDEVGPDVGYIHWVGVDPAHQGKGIGRLVTLAALHRFKIEGRRAATLVTDDFRAAACATYLSLGFVPVLNSEERRAMWRRVCEQLGERALSVKPREEE